VHYASFDSHAVSSNRVEEVYISLSVLTPECRSEGNLVNELDDGNPSKLLIAAIRKHGIEENGSFKDDNFYLGAFQDDKVSNPRSALFFRVGVYFRIAKPNVSHHFW
jgi:hypothetical protein